jgi:hypothetical protein
MSKIIAEAAIRGGHACVRRAETMLAEAIDRHGRDTAHRVSPTPLMPCP